MAIEVKSFKGITYNRDKVDIEKVVTPPYDVINSEEQESFYKKSEYNIIRLILGKEKKDDDGNNNRYTRAREFFKLWLKNKILIKDNEECLYYLEEKFNYNGKDFTRQGFIGILKLEEFEKGNIVPHEKTLKGPKKDRFNLMLETKANFSQIFGLYSDKDLKINSILAGGIKDNEKYFSFFYDKIKYDFWKINRKEIITQVIENIKDKKIFIADGHHRYETALMFRDYMRKKINAEPDKDYPFDYVMMYFCPMEEEGLLVLPTHRLLKNVNLDNFFEKANKFFIIEKTDLKIKDNLKIGQFLFFNGTDFFLFKLKQEFFDNSKLDVEILEDLIFKECLKITDEDISTKSKVDFIKDEYKGIELVKDGKYNGIFILHPPIIEKVREISLKRGVLPQKSTYFYPKLLTGLVIYSLEWTNNSWTI